MLTLLRIVQFYSGQWVVIDGMNNEYSPLFETQAEALAALAEFPWNRQEGSIATPYASRDFETGSRNA